MKEYTVNVEFFFVLSVLPEMKGRLLVGPYRPRPFLVGGARYAHAILSIRILPESIPITDLQRLQ